MDVMGWGNMVKEPCVFNCPLRSCSAKLLSSISVKPGSKPKPWCRDADLPLLGDDGLGTRSGDCLTNQALLFLDCI